jgi:hypothetical protein
MLLVGIANKVFFFIKIYYIEGEVELEVIKGKFEILGIILNPSSNLINVNS